MRERVKIFTFVRLHAETVVQPRHEDNLNQWLAETPGTLIDVTQSESPHGGAGQHVTLCLWYIPEEDESSS